LQASIKIRTCYGSQLGLAAIFIETNRELGYNKEDIGLGKDKKK
jgi:hypothetical protein